MRAAAHPSREPGGKHGELLLGGGEGEGAAAQVLAEQDGRVLTQLHTHCQRVGGRQCAHLQFKVGSKAIDLFGHRLVSLLPNSSRPSVIPGGGVPGQKVSLILARAGSEIDQFIQLLLAVDVEVCHLTAELAG